MRCAWPSDRKGSYQLKECKRPIKLDKGTASYPKAKEYQEMKIAGIQMNGSSEENSDRDSSSEEDSDKECSSEEDSDTNSSLEDDEDSIGDESEGELLDNSEKEVEEYKEDKNWWDSDSDWNSDIKLAGRKVMF